tara:strand:+ start:745 stop:885 length:141 start_codon:yes stop_codon:yes gene_type:complete
MKVKKKELLEALELLYRSCQPSGSLALYDARAKAKKIIEKARSGEE